MQGQDNRQDETNLVDQSGAPLKAENNAGAQNESSGRVGLKDVFGYIASYKVTALGVAKSLAIVVGTGSLSILYFNNETEVIQAVHDTPETILTSLDNHTTLITQGDNVALRYKGIVCPVAMSLPENVTLVLGNSGDASLAPSDVTIEPTLLGSLGINRNVSVTREIAPNAQSLMADFYAYAEDCNNKITALQANDKEEEAGMPVPLQSFVVAPPALEQ